MEHSWKFFALMFVLAEWIEPGDFALNNRNHITYVNMPYEIKRENNLTVVKSEPPPHELVAKMARYIVHKSDWTALATISTHTPIAGYPFANIFSVSDGPVHISKGVPYFYLTDMEISVQDLKEDSRTTITMSLAQTHFCKKHQYDPEDPLCAHIILTGKLVRVTDPSEKSFARKALFSRHPEMKDWPKDHGWWFGKLVISKICLLDYFGGVKDVDLAEYFATSPL
ncbi:protein CREG1-like [Daphnia pulicaria]|uniref:protein CREG1-like n=1 Tax=Daphnia pulicaria TaxID=35523 RepID=UPI001EE9C243|nr:protein CREG1-like [Daphnia pulicaria]XP_046639258.1 protein CREG1-like [Daphnia pulicaria]